MEYNYSLIITEDDSGNYVKETIDKKGKVVISENNSYNATSIIKINFDW